MYDPLRAKTRVALSVAGSFLFGLALATQFGFAGPAATSLVVQTGPRVSQGAVQPALDLSEAFVNIANAVTPAVVMIEATRRRQRPAGDGMDFFRRQQPRGQVPDIVPVGGSGFIVTEDGYVMTNNHVVESAERITVALEDGRRFSAEVVGADPTTDIAVVKIDGTGLPTASLGSSAEVRVGEWVLAIGNPGFAQTGLSPDLDYTVTAGIVSALGRSLTLLNRSLEQDPQFTANPAFAIEDFIQTDAVINSGNSGGPLVNLRGQVIGVNAAIVSRTGVYQGYGFAIPIDLAHRVMEDLVAHGRVRRAYMGVSIEPVREADADWLGLPEVAGAFVQDVTPGAPAERAGLRLYDVITAVDGESVLTGNDLQHKIALKAPGDRVRISLYRDGSPTAVTVALAEAPFTEEVAAAPSPTRRPADRIGIGEVRDIDARLARELGLGSRERGGAVGPPGGRPRGAARPAPRVRRQRRRPPRHRRPGGLAGRHRGRGGRRGRLDHRGVPWPGRQPASQDVQHPRPELASSRTSAEGPGPGEPAAGRGPSHVRFAPPPAVRPLVPARPALPFNTLPGGRAGTERRVARPRPWTEHREERKWRNW